VGVKSDKSLGFFGAIASAVAFGTLLVPADAEAQMLPHRAEYALRLGTAANAPRIGSAVQDIVLDCSGWQIRREITSEIAFTPSLKINVASKLEGEEGRHGTTFRYHARQSQNGVVRELRGEVDRKEGETRVEILSGDSTEKTLLPPATLLPVSAVNQLIDSLQSGAGTFPALLFAAEAGNEAYAIDIKELPTDALTPPPPAVKPVAVPSARFWPVEMTFKRPGQSDAKPLASVRAKVFSSGVLDRLTVDAGMFTVTADLQDLKMHEAPTCPGK
jgi:hypothetical protein